jgi:hypothetical protein
MVKKNTADIVTSEEYCNLYRRFLRWKTLGSDAQWHTKRVNPTRRPIVTT